jgi:hypothetical protein
MKIIILTLAFAFVSTAHCALSDKLTAASSKIASIKQDIKTGKFNIKNNKCKGYCSGCNKCRKL